MDKSKLRAIKSELLYVIYILLSCLCSLDNSAADDVSGKPVNTQEEALRLAYAYTGFEELKDLLDGKDYSNVNTKVFMDSTIPYIIDDVYGNRVWEVIVDGVFLDGPKWSRERVTKHNPKRFHIIIDSANGFFVKAFTKYEGVYDNSMCPEPSAAYAEAHMSDRFTGFCDSPPHIKLYEALGHAAGADPLGAKEIIALLVKQPIRGEPGAAWHIWGRGIWPPRLPLAAMGREEEYRNDPLLYRLTTTRTILDAQTRDLLGITSAPQPPLKPEHRKRE